MRAPAGRRGPRLDPAAGRRRARAPTWEAPLEMSASPEAGASDDAGEPQGSQMWEEPPLPGEEEPQDPRMELSEPPPGPVVGKEEQELLDKAFFSWAEFSCFFDQWCQQRLVVFSVKSSTHVARSPWASAPPLYRLIHVLKYSYVLLVCKDARSSDQSSSWPPQPSCPAFITVKLSPLRDRLVVSECQLTHSHPPCPHEFACHFRPGQLLGNTCLPVRVTNQISKQFVAPADVRRLLSHCKGPDHGVLDALHVLEGLFRTDPEAKVKLVFVEDQAAVETVFFLTSRTRALLRRFPRLLLVDRLPGLQGALDLVSVLCVDSAGRARQAACCVARPGTPSLLRFALASLLQSAPDIKGRVRCLIAGPEVAGQLRAVRQLLPCARVQICRAQGLETLFSKAQELGGATREDPGLWPLLCRLAGASSYAAYSEALAELRAQAPPAFVRYFEHNWAPRHDLWVHFRAYEAARDLDSFALVHGHRRRLLRRLSPPHGVAQCLRDLVAMQWADAAREAADDAADAEGPGPREPLPGPEPGGRRLRGDAEKGRGPQARDWKGARPENQVRGARREGVPAGRPEVRDWRGPRQEPRGGSEVKAALGERESREGSPGSGVHVKEEPGEPRPTPAAEGDRGAEGRKRLGPRCVEEPGGRPTGGRPGPKRRRGLEDIVVVRLGDTKAADMANGDGGQAGCGDAAGGELAEDGTDGDPEHEAPLEAGGGEAATEPKRLSEPSEEESTDWEPLARFRAACGPELADLVAEELAFARQHGAQSFHWTGAGFALKDGSSDFVLDRALTHCSCTIHAARRLPCRHLFAARLLTGAPLFHADLLRDCWGKAPAL
ncbi:uncharacterized protein ZSWIM9 isoform X3 [Perognathus longimembris pacificus]|uniref:uncharacterized protein ZSWIM9 isoform X3 n=1 Tax=Perognathus longimembris pacificus TaxID=214514 RepID=UPI002018ADD6|nr:uncharacterized protein ZSWIM9 isoform X3 [Perognathus longimembris pacificus]